MTSKISLSAATKTFISNTKNNFINGEWINSPEGFEFPVIEPSTESTFGSIQEATGDMINTAVQSNIDAFATNSTWRSYGPAQRETVLNALATEIENDATVLSELITLELGAPIEAAKHFEVNKAIETLRYYAGYPSKIHGEVINIDPDVSNQNMGSQEFFCYTRKEPVGVVAAIIPWNAPLMIAIWKLAPALAAGCTVVMKPSEEASLVILRLAELTERAGLPAGVFNVLSGRGESVGNTLVNHPGINKVTFTGSMKTGKQIHTSAANKLTRLSLELGGKSPVIIMPDANLYEAIPGVAMGAFANSGQVCVSGSRVFVHKDISNEFIEGVKNFASTLKMGCGFNDDTQIGPLVSQRQKQSVEKYLKHANESGAELYIAYDTPEKGFYISPTVITNLKGDSILLTEEIFGPVMTIETFESPEDIIKNTNESKYGLAAMIWSESNKTIHALTKQLRVGTVFVNTPAFPPPSVPTGGFRESGIGRDLGASGIEGFLETKSVITKVS